MSTGAMHRQAPDHVRRERTATLLAQAAECGPGEREELLNEVVVLNIQVAHAVARRFRNRGVPLEDLEQVACCALVRAAAKFDVSQDRDFLSYAVPTMSGELKRYFRDHGWTVRPPRRIQEIHSKVIAMHRSGMEDGRPATADDIAAALDIPVTDVREALETQGCFQPASLDYTLHEDGDMTVGDLLSSDDESEREALEARVMLQPVVRRLSERDRRILHLRFAEDCTQAQIGEELGVTQMQVSRLLSRILDGLREDLAVDELAQGR
ncbi:sigma-70 family RNA polymerase sigma factor [Nocardioides sp. dk4132]|uniref:sigma-70 family RNA polymerase sigma factor n=1 Tax=unclassified Nocardioides TaxID=2615069 RepID=UPI0012982000|nr:MULTISPECIES: sigma-70 family RNA polymerase sigma factor [unclassified Nocardioides]MQW75411.1 sigma-70 family RNA polymerase sigma factor [Nocardioides sp. dk4132]QGA08335.1 sigma-70 family RNA polymerase sigma factor [Nocardioides sp. dk884]